MLTTSMGVFWSFYRPSVRVWEGFRWQAAFQSGRFHFSLLFSTSEIMMTVHKPRPPPLARFYQFVTRYLCITLQNRINSVRYRTMNERGHTNSLRRMNAIGLENPLVKLNESDLTESKKLRTFMVPVRSCFDLVHLLCGVEVTSFIPGTDLMRFGMRLVWFRTVNTV